MYRLSVPAPSQKTPLFPKPKDTVVADEDEKKEEKKEEKKDVETKSVDDIVESVDSIEIEDSEESEDTECKDECNKEVIVYEEEDDGSIPIIFRSFKQGDMFSVPSGYEVRILEDLSGRISPNISQIYGDIQEELERYGQWNAHLYSAAANVIMNTPYSPNDGNTVTTPIFMKNQLIGQRMLRGIHYISISITMDHLSQNHPYLSYISSKLKWNQYDIVMRNSGESGFDERGKSLNMNIPIEYVSFDEPLNYMYIYIPGIHSSMKKLKVGETYREKSN
jgi:hypothetical protein